MSNNSSHDDEQILISEIDEIVNKLRTLDPKSEESAILLAEMKRKINQMSDE